MEIFKQIKEYPAYSISNKGTVRQDSKNRIMKPSRKPNGYMQINLFTGDGRRKKEYIHRLVALTFLPNPEKLPEVDHIDGIRENNVLENLQWINHPDNIAKSNRVVKLEVRRKDNTLVGIYDSIQIACDTLGLTSSNVSACLHESRQKSHKGYIFKEV